LALTRPQPEEARWPSVKRRGSRIVGMDALDKALETLRARGYDTRRWPTEHGFTADSIKIRVLAPRHAEAVERAAMEMWVSCELCFDPVIDLAGYIEGHALAAFSSLIEPPQ
jgi:hypothetical protein